MKINNFEIIKKLLNFDDPDKFYFVQIFKRRKDNPELKVNNKVIDGFYIYNEYQYDSLSSKIIEICDQNNARAYIRLNRRSDKKIALKLLSRLADRISNNDYKTRDLYESVAGEFHSEENKTWIVDIDSDYLEKVNEIEEFVIFLQQGINRIPICNKIPTKTGCHLITGCFNIQDFKLVYPELEILKDNPTVLYC